MSRIRTLRYSTTPAARAPRPSYITRANLYPFLLLTAMTSLALNLSYSRTNTAAEQAQLRAQLSVLTKVVLGLSAIEGVQSPGRAAQIEEMDRALEMVGLGCGKGKAKAVEVVGTTWRETLLGRKGKEWEAKEADPTDWEKGESDPGAFVDPSLTRSKVFREAAEADDKKEAKASVKPIASVTVEEPAPPAASIPATPAPPTLATYL